MGKTKEILTTGEVAGICKVAPRTVTKWFDSGRLKGYRIPGSRDRRIPLAELLRFMKAHGMPTEQLETGSNRALVVMEGTDTASKLIKRLKDSYEVSVVRSSFEAGLAIHKFMPDTVFVSLLSPTIDARAICREIRSNADLTGVRLVAVANSFSPSEEAALRQQGFDGCLAAQSDALSAIRQAEEMNERLA